MTAKIGADGKAHKIDPAFGDINNPILDVPPEFVEAVDLMRKQGLTEDEIKEELRATYQGNLNESASRIPPISSYQPPAPPLSQQTMDRLHLPAHKANEDPVQWAYKGESVRHRQFMQLTGAAIDEFMKEDLTLALICGKHGGFSAAEDLAQIFFNKQISQKSRIDLGGIPERLATVAQYNVTRQMFEETPERPKDGSKGFIRGLFGR